MTPFLWILIAIQLFMGAFDTLYHHEFRERLAWRLSQQNEIRFHGIRNLFYAIIFVTLGWLQPNGLWAYALIIILTIEVFITLKDFVEEDKSRTLPPTERVLHTLMALNYGAILAILVPVLFGLAANATTLTPVSYGYWSWMMGLSGVAVFVFGLRDLHAAKRLKRLKKRNLYSDLSNLKAPKTVLITGGTGFIGSGLIPSLQQSGYHIYLLTRDPRKAAQFSGPISVITDLDQIHNTTRIDKIINLAGAATASLWTQKQKAEMLHSRLRITTELNALINRLERKPELMISGSAIGVYGVNPGVICYEHTPIETDGSFAQELCQAWEQEAMRSGIPTTLLRIGIVLDYTGGPLAQMIIPTELGGGAVFGNGKHIMSWISRRDIIRLFGFILKNDITGPVNATAPKPVSNKTMTKALARRLGRPTLIAIPAFFLRLIGGLGREIFLGNQTVLPQKALSQGFQFCDETIDEALDEIFNLKKGKPRQTKTIGP